MKIIQKYLCLILITVFLFLIAVYTTTMEDMPLLHFIVQGETEENRISLYDAKDGNYYVFLPSYADLNQVTVSLSFFHNFTLGNTKLENGMTCGNFSPETPYTLSVDGKSTATLWFYQSANVATMYIDTAAGDMELIHSDKNHEEYVSMTLYAPDGKCNYSDRKSTLKGRGNSTWAHEKHPYLLTLSSDGDLLSMDAASDWVLLANAYDETNLNNKLILDLASHVGFQWSPECRWVDVYLNGEYNGLYLLTEQVEVHENRLNIQSNSGDFLCKVDLGYRWDSLQNPFATEIGRTVEITWPKILTTSQEDRIRSLVGRMEQALLSEEDLRESSLLDLDSWIRRYLIDEISGNADSDLASCNFYFTNGKFFAGPVWDYDVALGNSLRNQDPCAFIAKNAKKADSWLSPYYHVLYENDSFYNRMIEIYRKEFAPVLHQMLNKDVDDLIITIEAASRLNSLRWRSMYDSVHSWNPDSVCTADELKAYFTRRIRFLDSAWLDNVDYCTLQFEFSPDSAYWNISVPKNHCLETSYIDLAATIWIDTETGTVFDFAQPITKDLILTQQITDASEIVAPEEEFLSEDTFPISYYVVFLSIGICFVMLLVFTGTDISHRAKESSHSNAQIETKISSRNK